MLRNLVSTESRPNLILHLPQHCSLHSVTPLLFLLHLIRPFFAGSARNHSGNTPLHIAVENRHYFIAKMLIEEGDDDTPFLQNSKG